MSWYTLTCARLSEAIFPSDLPDPPTALEERLMELVKVTLERLECDVCGEAAIRYTLSFPDGMKVLDRCGKHDKKIQALREEPGDWSALTPSTKGKLTVLSKDEIESRRQK